MDLIDEIVLPKNWQELVLLKDIIPFCTNKVTRFPQDNQNYDEYRQDFSHQEHIQHILKTIGHQKQKITPNKFPYLRLIQHISQVKHYCLWSKTGPLTPAAIESEINHQFPNLDHFWFVNASNNKSIPEIWHCQIFIKEK